jgi:hypothetical protein
MQIDGVDKLMPGLELRFENRGKEGPKSKPIATIPNPKQNKTKLKYI